MDILKYVESNAISTRLRRMKYEFSALEMAWLIWWNGPDFPLSVRHDDWQWVIKNTEDCVIPERRNCRKRDSLHGLIQEYISFERSVIEEIEMSGDYAVYSYSYKCTGDHDWTEEFQNAFSSLQKCIAAVAEELPEEEKIVKIRKTYIDNNEFILANYNSNMQITSIEKSQLSEEERIMLAESFEGIWIELPTPFHYGDIVFDKNKNPYLLTNIPGWIKDKDNPKEVEFVQESKDYYWDYSDMLASGYSVSEDGLIWASHIYNSYLELEFCDEILEKEQRLIDALFHLVRKQIDIPMFSSLQRKVLIEYLDESLNLENRFWEGNLRMVGFDKEKK